MNVFSEKKYSEAQLWDAFVCQAWKRENVTVYHIAAYTVRKKISWKTEKLYC